jgi:hypothetical protein
MADKMKCCECNEAISGEWFDGYEMVCENCDALLVAVYLTDGSWVTHCEQDDE